MRKLDFNIVNLDEVPKQAKGNKTDAEIAGIQFCNIAGIGMGEARVNIHTMFRRIKDQIETEIKKNNGIVILDESDFNFFRSQFAKAKMPVERNINVVFTEILKVIEKAEKIEHKEKE